MDTEVRVCKTCGISRTHDRFGTITRGSKTYYLGTCKDCKNEKSRKGTKKVLWDNGVQKECGNCGIRKTHNEFGQKKGKPSSRCKLCHNKYTLKYYNENREKILSRPGRKNCASKQPYARHGLTKGEFDNLKTVTGLCPICNIRQQSSIDHDHDCCPDSASCGKCVRGYICQACNTGLGMLMDSPTVIESALRYLTSSQTYAKITTMPN